MQNCDVFVDENEDTLSVFTILFVMWLSFFVMMYWEGFIQWNVIFVIPVDDNSFRGLVMCMSWWRFEMEILPALLALCAGNSPVTSEFPSQRSVMQSFDVFFDLRLNKRFDKQSWGWWFETHQVYYDITVMIFMIWVIIGSGIGLVANRWQAITLWRPIIS